MSLPDAKPGLVIRYDYVWARASRVGSSYGKERPACLIATSAPAIQPGFVVLLPITHSPPDTNTAAIEIPQRVRQMLGLDDAPSWVIVSEYNVDSWPSAGLAPLPSKPDIFSYGFVPPSLFANIKEKFLEQTKQGAKAVDRR